MKKRIFAAILAVMMIMSLTAFTVSFAEEKTQISVGVVEVAPGATEAEITVSVNSLPANGLASARFNVKADGLAITEGTVAAALAESGYSVVGPTDKSASNGVNYMWADISNPLKADSELVTFKVTIPAEAAAGTEYAVALTLTDDPDDFLEPDGTTQVPVEAVSGKIVVGHKLTHVEAKEATAEADGNIEYWKCEACGKYFSDAEGTTEITEESVVVKYGSSLKGDMNGDGKLNARDVTALMKAILNKDTSNMIADMNDDGKLNARDVTALMKVILASKK